MPAEILFDREVLWYSKSPLSLCGRPYLQKTPKETASNPLVDSANPTSPRIKIR
jgi:hypothetical protein